MECPEPIESRMQTGLISALDGRTWHCFWTTSGIDGVVMTEGALTIQPARCLFESPEYHLVGLKMERRMRSFRLSQEAERACRRSVDRLREVYQFDVESLSPVHRNVTAAVKFDKYARSTFTPSASCKLLLDKENASSWCWEAVKTEEHYVPIFYHSVKYHSGGCLKTLQCQRLNPPDTPNKPGARTGSTECALGSVDELNLSVSFGGQIQSKTALTMSAKQDMFNIPPLFQFWRVRIRRAPHSECMRKSSSALSSTISNKDGDGDGPHHVGFNCFTGPSIPAPSPEILRNFLDDDDHKLTICRRDAETTGVGRPIGGRKNPLGHRRQLKLEEVLSNLKEISKSGKIPDQ